MMNDAHAKAVEAVRHALIAQRADIVQALVDQEQFEAAALVRSHEIGEIDTATLPEPPNSRPNAFTNRQWEILRLTAKGCTDQEICQQLYLSGRTVRRAQREIMQMMQVQTRAAVASIASIKGWFPEQSAPN